MMISNRKKPVISMTYKKYSSVLKLRLHIRVMREAWCVMRIARLHMYVKMSCVMRRSSFCWRSHPVRISCGFFTHRDKSSYLSKYKRFQIHSFCYIVPNVSNSDVVFIYSFKEVSYNAGCSSTKLTNFSTYMYVSSIKLHNYVIVTKK